MAGAPDRERATHRRLLELAETQAWVHHVADLDTGAVTTTVLDDDDGPRPPARAAVARSIDITMILLPGIEQLAFTGMAFGAAPLIAQAGVLA